MDIEGLGEKQIEQLYQMGYLTDATDIYLLKNYQEELLTIERFGKKKVENLLKAIEDSKNNSLDRFIFGLGIRFIGAKAAKVLVKTYDSIEDVSKARYEELLALDDFGEVMAKSIVDYFANPVHLELINKFISLGVNPQKTKQNEDQKLLGMTFVLTGTLETFSREEASRLIESLGGKTSSSVSKKTTYVLAGKEAGSKLTKAQELGIKIINEEEFKQMLYTKVV